MGIAFFLLLLVNKHSERKWINAWIRALIIWNILLFFQVETASVFKNIEYLFDNIILGNHQHCQFGNFVSKP